MGKTELMFFLKKYRDVLQNHNIFLVVPALSIVIRPLGGMDLIVWLWQGGKDSSLGLGIWWKFGPSVNRLILGGQLVN